MAAKAHSEEDYRFLDRRAKMLAILVAHLCIEVRERAEREKWPIDDSLLAVVRESTDLAGAISGGLAERERQRGE